MLKRKRALINKALTNKQKARIYKYIDSFDKINKYIYLQIIIKAANYLICFANYVVNH